MKKLLVAGFCFFVLAGLAQAQFRLGLTGGFALPTDSAYKGAVAAGLQAGMGFGKYFAVELAVSWLNGGVDGTDEGLSQGSLTRLPIELSLQGRYPVADGKFIPYIFAGGGYALHFFKLDASISDPWTAVGITIEEKVKGAPVFHAGLGFEFMFAPKMALQVNFKYLISSPDATWSQTDTVTGVEHAEDITSLSLSMIIINAGLKFSF
jgi:hypothetical protein